MDKRIQVSLAFNADITQAKMKMNELNQILTNLTNSSNNQQFLKTYNSQIGQAAQAAAQLQVQLQNAFNVNTGQLDLTKFQQSLKSSGMSLEQYRQQLAILGPQGNQAFAQVARAITTANTQIKHSINIIEKMKSSLMNVGQYLISTNLLRGLTQGATDAIQYIEDLNSSLNDIRIVTGYSSDKMREFAVEANKAAKSLSTTTNEYAKASLIFYQQGLSDSEVKERTDATIKMANVSGQSAETVSDQLTAIWNNFDNGSKSLEYYVDVVTALGAATASSSEEIATGLEKFAAVADTVGLSYEYATAALATVTATTRQSADVVGTAFKTLFARIQDLELGNSLDDGVTLGKYSQALEAIGVNVLDATGNVRDMNNILDEMGTKWDSLTEAQKVSTAQTVAGVRQYTQLIALMENWDTFQENVGVASNSEGALSQQAKIYEESWRAAKDRVKAAAEDIYDSLLKDEFFIDLTNNFAQFLDIIENVTDSLGGLQSILLILGSILMRTFGPELLTTFKAGIISLIPPLQKAKNEALQTEASKAYGNATYKDFGLPSERAFEGQKQGDDFRNRARNFKNTTEVQKQVHDRLMDQYDAVSQKAFSLEQEYQEEKTARARSQKAVFAKDPSRQQSYNDMIEKRQANWTAINQASDLWEKPINQDNLTASKISAQNLAKDLRTSGVATSLGLTDDTGTGALDVLEQKLKNGQLSAQDLRKALKEVIDVANTNIDDANQNILEEWAKDSDKLVADLEEVKKAKQELDKAMAEEPQAITNDQKRKAGDKVKAAQANYDKVKSEAIKKQFKEEIEIDEELAIKNQKVEEAYRERDAAGQNVLTHEKTLAAQTMQTSEAFSSLASTAMMISSAISSLRSMFQTLSDETATTGEKITAVVTGISMAVTTLSIAFNKNTVMALGSLSASLLQAVGYKGVALSATTAAGATGVLTGAINTATGATISFGAALWSILWPIGLVMLAIAAVVVIVNSLIKAFESEEKKAKKALENTQKNIEALETSIQNAKEANQEFIDSYSKYDEAVKNIKNLEEGTDEYKKAVIEANKQARQLIETYGLWDKYTIKNGVITFDEGVYDEINAQQQNIIKNLQNVLTFEKINRESNQSQLNLIESKGNINEIITDYSYKQYLSYGEQAQELSTKYSPNEALAQDEAKYGEGITTGSLSQSYQEIHFGLKFSNDDIQELGKFFAEQQGDIVNEETLSAFLKTQFEDFLGDPNDNDGLYQEKLMALIDTISETKDEFLNFNENLSETNIKIQEYGKILSENFIEDQTKGKINFIKSDSAAEDVTKTAITALFSQKAKVNGQTYAEAMIEANEEAANITVDTYLQTEFGANYVKNPSGQLTDKEGLIKDYLKNLGYTDLTNYQISSENGKYSVKNIHSNEVILDKLDIDSIAKLNYSLLKTEQIQEQFKGQENQYIQLMKEVYTASASEEIYTAFADAITNANFETGIIDFDFTSLINSMNWSGAGGFKDLFYGKNDTEILNNLGFNDAFLNEIAEQIGITVGTLKNNIINSIKSWDEDKAYNSILASGAQELNLTEDALIAYTQSLQDNRETTEDIIAITQNAIASQKHFAKVRKSEEALEKVREQKEGTIEYYSAYGDLIASLEEQFGVSFKSFDNYKEILKAVSNAAEDGTVSLEKLQKELGLLTLANLLPESTIEQQKDMSNYIDNMAKNAKEGNTISFSLFDFLKKGSWLKESGLEWLVENGLFSEEDIFPAYVNAFAESNKEQLEKVLSYYNLINMVIDPETGIITVVKTLSGLTQQEKKKLEKEKELSKIETELSMKEEELEHTAGAQARGTLQQEIFGLMNGRIAKQREYIALLTDEEEKLEAQAQLQTYQYELREKQLEFLFDEYEQRKKLLDIEKDLLKTQKDIAKSQGIFNAVEMLKFDVKELNYVKQELINAKEAYEIIKEQIDFNKPIDPLVIETYEEKIQDLSSAVSNLYANMESFKDNSIKALEEVDDKYQKTIEKIEIINDGLQTFKEILKTSAYGLFNNNELSKFEKDINWISFNTNYGNVQKELQNRKVLLSNISNYEKKLNETSNLEQKKHYEQLIETEEEKLKEANDNILNYIQEGLNAIKENFELSLKDAVEDFAKSVTGYSSLDNFREAYDFQKKESESYLDNTKKAYELSKLARQINTDISNQTSVRAQNKLRDVLDEINKLQENNNKMTELELKNLQAKYDLRVAEIALEEAQWNKTQMRLQRGANGSWSYIYTANAEAVAQAQQNLEDKQYALYEQNLTAINQASDNLVNSFEDYQKKEQEIATQLSTGEITKQQAVESRKINAQNLAEAQRQAKEIKKAMKEAGIEWKDTDLGKSTHTSSIDEYMNKTTEASVNLVQSSQQALTELGNNTTSIMNLIGINGQNAVKSIKDILVESAKAIGSTSSIAQQQVTEMKGQVELLNNQIDTFWENWYLGIIKWLTPANEELEKAIGLLRALQTLSSTRYTSNRKGYGNSGLSDSDLAKVNANRIAWLNTNDEDERTRLHTETEAIMNKAGYTYNEQSGNYKDKNGNIADIFNAATGGYTGEWGDSSGRLGILHEKELVLNKEDTKNILSAVGMVRDLSSSILKDILTNANIMPNILGTLHNAFVPKEGLAPIEQNVHIEANFPNVNNRLEIEAAFADLVNQAAQFASEKK